MGEEFAFFDHEGVARPKLVATLKALPDPPRDPELLASLIETHAGVDLDIKLAGFEAARRSARRKVLDAISEIRLHARSLCLLQTAHPELNLFEIALQDLIESAGREAVSSAYIGQVSAAVERLAEVPLPSDLSAFGRKPQNDETVQHVVNAVADYYERMGMRFTGAPRRKQTDDGPTYPLHSAQAKMTAAVLAAVGLKIPEHALATYIGKARKAVGANLPT